MYALAASAAGVGVLALAQPTEGKIIYTKAHKTIGLKDTLHLDLNHDGIADFDLKNVRRLATYSSWDRLSAIPARRKNAVWGHTMWRAYASALSAGSWVGPKGQFLPGAGMMASTSANGGRDHPESIGNGPWANVTNRYLGLKFVIKGKIHFGWARLNVRCNNTQVTAILTGYAYETIANKPILTGREHGVAEPDVSTLISSSPATLGWLARGSKSRPGD
jgi:hypothetical protein